MNFASDNAGPAHPKVMDALLAANDGYARAYGADDDMAAVQALIREQFEAPDAAVFLVATGTAANALALACLSQPWHIIFCAQRAHITEDECNAPEFFTGGAKLKLVGRDAKMTPDDLRGAMEEEGTRGVHGGSRGPVSLTNVTERGDVYSAAEIAALCEIARTFGSAVHLDGARLANALASTNASPAEMTWRAGVDVVTLGGTKNGLLGVEAVVFFDPKQAHGFEFRRKRAGHLFSKHRYLSVQMRAYLEQDLWRSLAARANARAARLEEGLRDTGRVQFPHQRQANMVFCSFERATHQALHTAGVVYNIQDGLLDGDPAERLTARFVCDWSKSIDEVEQLVALF